MKKKFIILWLISTIAISASAQIITFEKTYGGAGYDESYCVKQTSDSGYILIGNTNSFGNNYDIYLIKTNSYGDTIWTKTYGGNNWEGGRWVQQTFDGGYVATGWTLSFGAGNNYLYLVKTNANGDSIWTKTIGEESYNTSGNYIEQTSDSNFIVTGSFGTNTITDFFLTKVKQNGDTLWTKKYKGIYSNSGCYGNIVKETSDGGFIIAGTENNNSVPANLGWLIKTNNNGDTLWTKKYIGLNYARLNSLHITNDGGYILVGDTYFEQFGMDALLLIRTDSNGNTIWSKTIDSFLGKSIQQTEDGGYIIAGITNYSGTTPYDLYLLKINSIGDTLWSKTFGSPNNDWGFSAIQTTDKGYILTGSINKVNDLDIILIKTDSIGKILISINEFTLNNITAYYNGQEELIISYDLKEKTNKAVIIIYDVLGKEILQKELLHNQNKTSISLNKFPQGVYLLNIQSEDGIKLAAQKFIKY